MQNNPQPENKALTARLAGLSPGRRALAERLLRERGTLSSGAQKKVAGLSFGQLRLWFMAQLDPLSKLFDRSTVERLAGHLAMLLAALVDNPDAPISRIQMLTPDERLQLEDLDDTAATSPSDCVVGLIDAHAARTPEALAIGKMTYRELVHAANGVAYRLLACGAHPDKLVAVSLRRGSDQVVALLGIWKAGAGYLPLDPDDPPARRQHILADARPLLVLDDPTGLAPQGQTRRQPPKTFAESLTPFTPRAPPAHPRAF